MTPSPPASVALFGLSADPPTGMNGHVGIVSWAARTLPVDQVWVLPVHQHAFHEKQHMTPYAHRLAMARLAFDHLPGLEDRIQVKETEKEVGEEMARAQAGWVGTVDVVRHLQAQFPNTHFVVLMGGDTYRDYLSGKWKGGRELEKLLPIYAVPRQGMEGASNVSAPPQLGDVSSRALRASNDSALWEREVPAAVRRYAEEHQLYRR